MATPSPIAISPVRRSRAGRDEGCGERGQSRRPWGTRFPPFRFHDLRHRRAVDWLKAARSIYDLQQRLGHASVKTTEIYLKFLTSEEARATMYAHPALPTEQQNGT